MSDFEELHNNMSKILAKINDGSFKHRKGMKSLEQEAIDNPKRAYTEKELKVASSVLKSLLQEDR